MELHISAHVLFVFLLFCLPYPGTYCIENTVQLPNELASLPSSSSSSSSVERLNTALVPRRRSDMEPTIDPESSWINFVRRSRNKRKPRRRDKSSGDERSRSQPSLAQQKEWSAGGTERISKGALLQEMRNLVREEVDKQLQQQCPECVHNVTLRPLPHVDLIPRITVAFSIKLKHNAPIKQKAMMELRTFYKPFTQGSPQRGTRMNSAKHGRFVVPLSGIYHVTASLHVAHDGYKQRRPRKLRRTEKVEAAVCIDSQCNKNNAVTFISGLESNSRTFTISLNGLLELKAGQYVSVFVDNQSHRQVTVLKESSFTGLLLGG